MALTTHPHLAPRSKAEKGNTSIPPLGLRGLFYGEYYLLYLGVYSVDKYICYSTALVIPLYFFHKIENI